MSWPLIWPYKWAPDAAGSATHDSSGDIVAQSATVSGTAAHNTVHATSGDLTATAATVAGSADHTTPGVTSHPSSGSLDADAATVSGTAAHSALHATTGDLAAQTATVSGTALHNAVHATTGDLLAEPASVSGTAVDETSYVPPAPKTGAGKSKKPRRRIEVEIDGEVYAANSPEEAKAILEDVRQKAEQTAKLAIDRAAKATRKPVRKVIADARKTLEIPEIVAPPSLRDSANQLLGDIRAQYESALASIEIAARLSKIEREIEDDDEDILLLL